MTLLDYPGKIACTIFTAGCNMRCPFCQNAGLVTHIDDGMPFYSDDEIIDFLKMRKGKLDGICISGGEPSLQKNLREFIERVKAEGFFVKLDTNGTNPDKLNELIEAKLIDYVAIDVKNVPEKYNKTSGVTANYEKISRSIRLLKESGVKHEFRTTVVKELHSFDDLVTIAKMIAPSPYFLQQFVNSGDLVGGKAMHAHSEDFLTRARDACQKYTITEIRGI